MLKLNSENNQNIIKLYDIAQDEEKICLLMEYCPYKDLSSYMERHFPKNNNNNISNYNNDPLIGPWDGFNELIVLYFIFQLTSAIKCMNEINICHRDLKPQNILLTYDPERRLHALPRDTFSYPTSYCLVHLPILKVTDFDFAKILSSEDLTATMLGTPNYMAPEILNGKHYSNLADLWSVGVILYQLAASKLPYTATSREELGMIVTSNDIDFYFPGEENFENEDKTSYDPNAFCPEIKKLIRNLLIKNSKKRISYEEFFKFVNGKLKSKWDLYRDTFKHLDKNEKEKDLGPNDEINIEYDENHSIQFIPIPKDLTNKFVELISKSHQSTNESYFDDSDYSIIYSD